MLPRNQSTLKYSSFERDEVSVKGPPRRNNIMDFGATPGPMASKTQQASQIVQGNRREFSNQVKHTHFLRGGPLGIYMDECVTEDMCWGRENSPPTNHRAL